MELNQIFKNGMVLQAEKKIRIFGNGTGNLSIDFLNKKVQWNIKENEWCVELESADYGGPYTMTINLDGQEIVLSDIMVGDVYLCAGQSNMKFKHSSELNYETDSESNNLIRMFFVDSPENDGFFKSKDGWTVLDKKTAGYWSAVAYHMSVNLIKQKNVAIGIIECYQGASVIQSWFTSEIDEKYPIPKEDLHQDHYRIPQYRAWNDPEVLYKKMFKKIVPYSLKNVIWYQGESNTSVAEGKIFDKLLCELIDLWRQDERDKDLPFIVIQICDYIYRDDEGWKTVQKMQEKVSLMRDYVSVVTSSDVCSNDNIHPNNKKQLGIKVANCILKTNY